MRRLPRSECSRVGVLHQSAHSSNCWGFENVLRWINHKEISEQSHEILKLVNINPDHCDFAVSLISPSVFNKSIFGEIEYELNLHIDLVCHTDSPDAAIDKAAQAIQDDFMSNESCVSLYLELGGARKLTLVQDNFDLAVLKDELESAVTITSYSIKVADNKLVWVSKTYTIFRVWKMKKVGKLLSSSHGTPPLLNLLRGVIIHSTGAEIYESVLLQTSYSYQESMPTKTTATAGARNVLMTLNAKHPVVVNEAKKLHDSFRACDPRVSTFKYSRSLVFDLLSSPNITQESENVLQEVYLLHQSSAAKFYNLAAIYKNLEDYFNFSCQDTEDISRSVSSGLVFVSSLLNEITYESLCSPVHKWYAQVLENSIYFLEKIIHEKAQYLNIGKFLGVEKVSCRVASLLFLPPAIQNLPLISEMISGYTSAAEKPSFTVPNAEEIGLYEPQINKSVEYGIDVGRNSAKIQSVANMHTIAVLLQYQNDMRLDRTLENVINTVSNEFTPNPYNDFIMECLLSSHRVTSGTVSDKWITDLLCHKPKLRDSGHLIYSIEGNIFGRHHSVFQADIEGLSYVLSICKTVQNNPYITKKDGIRIMHTTFPKAEHLVCGRLSPVLYTLRCEEYYVMIKETRSATPESGVKFLVEMLYLHLVDMAKEHIVVGYLVDQGDLTLLDMSLIQARPTEKEALVGEIKEVLDERSQLTMVFFVKTEMNTYVKVIKDVKPIYADQSADLYDHFTPCDPLNANFAVFSKLHPATFFYDYAEGTSENDIQFVINQLNRSIVREAESWDIYKTIQLKHMLEEDPAFLPTAFQLAHSTCSKLRGIQDLNENLSVLLNICQKVENLVVIKDMVIDFVGASKKLMDDIDISTFLKNYIKDHLQKMYQNGEPNLDSNLEKQLKDMFIIFSSLAQYFEKEFVNSSSYKLQVFISEAASNISDDL